MQANAHALAPLCRLATRLVRRLPLRCRRTVARRGLRTRSSARAAAAAADAGAEGLQFRFNTPNAAIYNNTSVKMVVVPGEAGTFAMGQGHVPIIAQLKPGVVNVFETDTAKTDYFISGGFAVVKEDGTASVTAAEACEVSEIDPQEVSKQIAKYEADVASAKDDEERVMAQIGVTVARAMEAAVSK